MVKDKENEIIQKNASEYEGKESIILENLQNCQVFIPFVTKQLFMKNMRDCKVYAGCVNGSTFVNDLSKCELRFQSHQTRIHNST